MNKDTTTNNKGSEKPDNTGSKTNNNNEFKAPPVGSYIPEKTHKEVHDDLLASYGYTDNNNTGYQK